MKITPQAIKAKVAEETKLTAEVVRLLAEFEFSGERERLQFSSLYAFCLDYLGYCKGSAWRRVKAVKLLRRDPRVVQKLASGELNLTTAAKIEIAMEEARKQRVELPVEELFAAARGSTRTAEEKIEKLAESHGVKTEKPSVSLKEKIERVRAIRSQKCAGLSDDALLHLVLDEILEKEDPARRPACPRAGAEFAETRYITPKLEAYVWQRDESRCTHVNSHTKERCRETRHLEIDHEIPFARGGLTNACNLRLLCRAHNQQRAKANGLLKPATTEPGLRAPKTPAG